LSFQIACFCKPSRRNFGLFGSLHLELELVNEERYRKIKEKGDGQQRIPSAQDGAGSWELGKPM